MGRGGARPGAGRKAKAVETGLAALLGECWTEASRRQWFTQLANNANMGDLESGKLLMAYTYGKPVERKEITGADGQPLFKMYDGFDPDEV